MMFIEVLTEGASDVPIIREVLTRHFKLREKDFRVHPHCGKGKIPSDLMAQPSPKHRGLLDQLPAKLRGFGRYMDDSSLVLVLIDVDQDDCVQLLAQLKNLLAQLDFRPPRVLFRLAVEETESWFLADTNAIALAFPKAKLKLIQNIPADAKVGAWEKLAECLGKKTKDVTGSDKIQWAEKISPHVNLQTPFSPSLGKLLSGLERELKH